MTPSSVRLVVVAERSAWVRRMVDGIRHLPLESLRSATPNCTASALTTSGT